MRYLWTISLLLLITAACSCLRQSYYADKPVEKPLTRESAKATPPEQGSSAGSGVAAADGSKPAADEAPPLTLPEGWPAGLPQYPGSTISNVTRSAQGGRVVTTVVLSTGDQPASILSFYDDKAKAAGFEKKVSISSQNGGGTTTYEGPQSTFGVSVERRSEDKSTTVSLMLSLHAPDGQPDEPQEDQEK